MSRYQLRLVVAVLLVGLAGVEAHAQAVKPRAILDKIDYSLTNYAAAFTADSKTLATGGHPHSLKLWNAGTGKLIADRGEFVNENAPSVNTLAFSPDGKTLAIGRFWGGATVELWDPKGDRPCLVLKGHEDLVRSVQFSPDGKTLASASKDGTARLWDPATGKPLSALGGFKEGATQLVFSPDGKTLYAGSGGGDVLVHDVKGGKLLRTLKGHAGSVHSLGLSADGKVLMSADHRGTIKVWDAAGGKVTRTLKGRSKAVLTGDGKHVIAIDEILLALRIEDGKQVLVLWMRHRHTFPHALVLSPDGKTLASVNDDSRVVLWDVKSILTAED